MGGGHVTDDAAMDVALLDRAVGSVLASASGDALGAGYEFEALVQASVGA